MTTKAYAATSGIIFLIVAFAHLARVAFQWDFRIGTWDAPPLVSVIAVLVAGFLGYTGLRIASRSS